MSSYLRASVWKRYPALFSYSQHWFSRHTCPPFDGITLMLFLPRPHTRTTMIPKALFGSKGRGAVNASPPLEPEKPKQALPPDLQRWSDFMDPFPPVSVGGYIRYYRSRASSVKEPSHIPIPSLSHAPPPSSSSDATVPTSPLFPTSSAAPSPAKHVEKLTIVTESSSEPHTPAINRASPACESESSPALPRVNSLRRKRRRLLRTPSIERDFAVSARHLFASHISLSLSRASSSSSSDTRRYTASASADNSSGEESLLTPLSRRSSESSSSSAKSPITPVNEGPPLTIVVVGVDDNRLMITPEKEEKDHARAAVCDLDLGERPDTWASYHTAFTGFDDV